MNKTAIKNFAIWARNKLIADICYRAGLMGITEKGIADPLPRARWMPSSTILAQRSRIWWQARPSSSGGSWLR